MTLHRKECFIVLYYCIPGSSSSAAAAEDEAAAATAGDAAAAMLGLEAVNPDAPAAAALPTALLFPMIGRPRPRPAGG